MRVFLYPLIFLIFEKNQTRMTTAKTPLWFWVVGALLLLWNATGIFNFSSQIMMTEKMLLTLPIEQQELFAHFSWWVKAAFGMGVFGGL